jgi:hypothetical protein
MGALRCVPVRAIAVRRVVVAEDEFSLDIGIAAPGIGAFTYGANAAFASHEAHLPAVTGIASVKPWGHDTIGKAFEENYNKILPEALHAWYQITFDVAELAINLVQAQEAAWQANLAATQQMNLE